MAVRHRRLSGLLLSGVSQVGVAVPAFLAGILLITAVRRTAGLAARRTAGRRRRRTPSCSSGSSCCPRLALGLVQGAVLTRYVRSAVLDVLREDYLRTARAKGLRPMPALVRHGLRNAAVPVVTVLGLQLATLLIGAVVVERVFVIPGLGQPAAGRRRQPRPHPRAGRRDAARRRRPGGQLRRRPALPRPRPPTARRCAVSAPQTRELDPGAGRRSGRRLGPSLVVGGLLVRLVVAMALVSFVWTPYDPTLVDPTLAAGAAVARRSTGSAPTSSAATCSARSWSARGRRCSSGFVAVGVAAVIGVPLGHPRGDGARGWFGEVVMRANDLLLAFPALLLAIMFGAVFGASTLTAMIAIGIATVPSFARVVRSGALQVMRTEYVLAARAAGRRPGRSPCGTCCRTSAASSSCRPRCRSPSPSWPRRRCRSSGSAPRRRPRRGAGCCRRARSCCSPRRASRSIPGVAIAIAVLGFNLLGDGLRDRFDPRLEDRR